ncbi:hypothetical protein M1N18_00915 [Dehalococcoidales bacterium]|nr:hypothetical protein [Dehalococcoidales bacterium]
MKKKIFIAVTGLLVAILATAGVFAAIGTSPGDVVGAPPPEQGTPAGVVAEVAQRPLYEVKIDLDPVIAIPATGSDTIPNAVQATVYRAGVYSITMSIMNVDQLKKYYEYMAIVFRTSDDRTTGDGWEHTVDQPGPDRQLMALTLDNPTDTTLFYAGARDDELWADATIYWNARDVPHSEVPILLKVLIEAH